VAVAELDGRSVVISGNSDRTVRVWDLAAGTPGRCPVHRPHRLGACGEVSIVHLMRGLNFEYVRLP
jgi:hypothetical protein